VLLDEVAELQPIAAVTTERLQQDRYPRLVLDHHLQQDLMQVGPVISTLAPGDRHDLYAWGLVAVGASVDMEAGRVERRQGGNEAQTLGSTPYN
jgi:hypothetical protein